MSINNNGIPNVRGIFFTEKNLEKGLKVLHAKGNRWCVKADGGRIGFDEFFPVMGEISAEHMKKQIMKIRDDMRKVPETKEYPFKAGPLCELVWMYNLSDEGQLKPIIMYDGEPQFLNTTQSSAKSLAIYHFYTRFLIMTGLIELVEDKGEMHEKIKGYPGESVYSDELRKLILDRNYNQIVARFLPQVMFGGEDMVLYYPTMPWARVELYLKYRDDDQNKIKKVSGKVFIMGSSWELGEQELEIHKEIGMAVLIASKWDDVAEKFKHKSYIRMVQIANECNATRVHHIEDFE